MTYAEILRALRTCTFGAGTWDKRFVREMNQRLDEQPDLALTIPQQLQVYRLAHSYRKQLGKCLARNCQKCVEKRRGRAA